MAETGSECIESVERGQVEEGGGRPSREDGGGRLEAGGLAVTRLKDRRGKDVEIRALTSREDGRRDDMEVRALTRQCGVCSAPAPDHKHYGAVSCHSCR